MDGLRVMFRGMIEGALTSETLFRNKGAFLPSVCLDICQHNDVM